MIFGPVEVLTVPEDHEATRRSSDSPESDLVVWVRFTGNDGGALSARSSPGVLWRVGLSACPPAWFLACSGVWGRHHVLPAGGPGPGIGLSPTRGGVFKVTA